MHPVGTPLAGLSDDELARRFLPFAKSVAWRYVRLYPAADADEVCSDALLGLAKVVLNRERDSPDARFWGYLRATIESECLRGARDRARAFRRNGVADEEALAERAHPVLGHQRLELREAMDMLPLNELQAATLCHWYGFSQNEAPGCWASAR